MPDIVFYWRRRWFAARSLTAAALVCCAQPNSGGDEGVAGEITLRITMESGQAGPARSVMPGSSWTEPVAGWELSLYDTDRDTPFQQNYFQRGQDILFSLREAKPIRVKAAGYAVWESGRPSGTKLLETRAFLEFTVEQVRSGQVSVKVEPLADAVEGTSGNIDLQVKWDTVNTPALTRLKAALKDSDGNAISIGLNYNSVTVSDGSSVDITAGGKEAQIQANEVPAGWYTLVLTFYKDVNGDDVAAGIFHESVTVWPGTTANSWIRPSVNGMGGGSYQYMNITEADFASARANVLSIKVYKDSETNAVLDMATADTGETLLFPAHAIFSASSLRFVIDFFAPGDAPTGAGIYETVLINNDRTSRTLPGSYGYPHPQAYPYYYVYEFTLEATDIGHIAAGGALKITARAPDFFTRKTYTLTSSVAAARNYAGTAVYYPTLSAAIDAASGTEGAPDTITVLRDIGLDNEEIAAIAAAWPAGTNKHIKLTPTGITRTLKRITANTGAFFTVGSGSSLTLEGNGTGKLILDGGAVWTGSTPATLPEGMTSDDFPSPAFGAENVSGINASGPLVAVNSGGAFTMNAGAVLQNNNYNSRGGGVYVNSGGTFTMNGGAVVKGNRSLRNGGGVFVTAGGTFTMSGGTISGNTATQSGGGVHVNGNGNGAFTMFGGTINGNTATINGDGVCFSNGTFTMSDAAVINANNDVFLPSGKMITIGGTLNGTAPVATITPDTYGTTRQVLTASGSGSIANNYHKFAVTPNGTTPWGIDNEGKLALAVARRGAVSPYSYYATLALAIAAASGTSSNPDTITILQNIDINASVITTITTAFSANKHIKLTVPANTTYILKRIMDDTGAIFTVGSGSSLTLAGNGSGDLILDGGAVWNTNGQVSAVLPGLPVGMTLEECQASPAFDASRRSDSINANGPLVTVNGGTFKMNTGAVLRNNNSSSTSGSGGGVFVNSGGTFTMNDGAVVKGNKVPNRGGGVYVSGASSTFTMFGGVVKGNKVENGQSGGGGGVYVDNGTFTMYDGGMVNGNMEAGYGGGGGVCTANNGRFIMDGGMVNGNRAANSTCNGGGVQGTITMSGGEISGNNAGGDGSGTGGGGYGGGVYGTLTMLGGSINGNKAAKYGGGVNGTLTMSGGTISGNTAIRGDGGGGGVNGTLTMSGGTISGNTATGNGKGVNVSGTLTMSDTAVINANNDVFLPSGKTITISGNLNGTAPVATITPQNYTAGTQVLTANPYLAGNYNRFAVTQSGWVIDSDGKLAQ